MKAVFFLQFFCIELMLRGRSTLNSCFPITVLLPHKGINTLDLATSVSMPDSISLQKELNDVEFESVIDGKWPVTWLVLHLV